MIRAALLWPCWLLLLCPWIVAGQTRIDELARQVRAHRGNQQGLRQALQQLHSLSLEAERNLGSPADDPAAKEALQALVHTRLRQMRVGAGSSPPMMAFLQAGGIPTLSGVGSVRIPAIPPGVSASRR